MGFRPDSDVVGVHTKKLNPLVFVVIVEKFDLR